jgi:hypothetical protein
VKSQAEITPGVEIIPEVEITLVEAIIPGAAMILRVAVSFTVPTMSR